MDFSRLGLLYNYKWKGKLGTPNVGNIPCIVHRLGRRAAIQTGKEIRKVRELISIASFIMAVIGALATIFIKERDKQTMASIVGIAFLISFFINVSKEARLFLQIACIVTFCISMVSGIVSIFSGEESKRTGAIVTGIVSLGTSLLILFLYLELSLF